MNAEVRRLRVIRGGGAPVSSPPVPAAPPPEASPAGAPLDPNVETIREILFGSHMREIQAWLDELEEKCLAEIGNVRSELHRRMDTLDLYIRHELDLFSQRLDSEQNDRGEALAALGDRLQQETQNVRADIAQLDETLASTERSLREDQERSQAEMQQRMEHETEVLRGATVSRESLANLLTDLSERLRQ